MIFIFDDHLQVGQMLISSFWEHLRSGVQFHHAGDQASLKYNNRLIMKKYEENTTWTLLPLQACKCWRCIARVLPAISNILFFF